MAGRANWEVNVSSNIKEIVDYTDKLRGELTKIQDGNYQIKLNIDEKKLANVISNLDKMLSNLGKGTKDFKQLENLSKEISSISSEIQNLSKAFGKIDDSGTKTLLNSIQSIDSSLSELSKHILDTTSTEQLKKATQEAVQAKQDFATANENVQSSVADSKSPLQLEAELMNQIATSAREAANAKKEFVEANKQVEASADKSDSGLGGNAKKKDKYANRSKISEDNFLKDNRASIANKSLKNRGYTILGSSVDTELVNGLVNVKAKIKDADGTWKTFSAKIDADGNMFSQRFRTITKGINQLNSDLSNFGQDSVKTANTDEQIQKFKELNNAIDRYEVVKKRIAKGTGYESDNAEAEKLLKTINEITGKAKGSTTILSNEQLSVAEERLNKINQTISDINNGFKKSVSDSVSKYKEIYDTKASKPQPKNQSDQYKIGLNNLDDSIKNLRKFEDELKNTSDVTDEQRKTYEELTNACKQCADALTKMDNSEKGSNELSRLKEAKKLGDYLDNNTRISKQAREELKMYLSMLESGDPSVNVKEIAAAWLEVANKEKAAGREGKSFLDTVKEKTWYSWASQLGSMISFYDIINGIKQVSSTVIQLNTDITDLAKVSEATTSQIYEDFDSYADIAKDIGGTISDTIKATAAWSKNGYNIPDSKELARVSQLYKNVGDDIDIDSANESLISTLKGFQLEADDAEHIIDVFNEVSNNEAISSSGIGEALQRSAASFNAANTSLEKSVALITATNSVLQDPDKSGNMWKTVSARIRGADTELQAMGEDTDGMVKSTSKLQDLIKGMTGFDILESDGKTFKDIYDIVLGIAEAWNDLDDIQQASLLEKLAGKNQSNALAAALSNIDILKKSYQEAMNSEGSAMREQDKYEQSVQYSIDQTKAKIEELSNDLLSSNFLKGLIDAGGKLISILDFIIDKFGVISALLGGFGLTKFVKNLDLLLNWSLHTQGCSENGVTYKRVLLRFKKEPKTVMVFGYCVW